MEPTDAIELINIIPRTNAVETRRYTSSHQTAATTTDRVQTLATLNLPDGNEHLIAGTNGELVNVTGTPSSLGSGFSSDLWQTEQFKNFLFLVNGVDEPQVYDGAFLSSVSWTGPLDDRHLAHVNAYKSRLYFCEEGTATVWYTDDAGDVSGALLDFDASQIFQRGGKALFTAKWTQPTGSGDEHQLVIVSSAGDVLIYNGSYLGDPNVFLSRRFTIPRPLARRAYIELGGDVLVLTEVGLVSLAGAMRSQVEGLETSLTDKITPTMKAYASTYGNLADWNVTWNSGEKLLWITVPTSDSTSEEVVINLETGASAICRGINAFSMAEMGGELYLGCDNGEVKKYGGDTGSLSFSIRPAFNHYGDRGRNKRFTAILPLIAYSGNISIQYGIDTDLEQSGAQDELNLSLNITPWGSPWGSPWSQLASANNEWLATAAQGRSASLTVLGTIQDAGISLNSSQVIFETGGLL